MSVTLVPEGNLRAALRPYRVDPDAFEAAVRARLNASLRRIDDPIASLSPALRSAAAFLPLEVIIGDEMKGAAAKLAPATGVYKLLSYAAFPACRARPEREPLSRQKGAGSVVVRWGAK
jgi:hypothetical protein